jgi:hypothetical protein
VNDRDVTDVLDRLVGNLDDEVADWDDVLERASMGSAPQRRWRSRWTLVAVGAACAAAALVVALTAPWGGGPDVVDRAAAAILAPTRGVLYERITVHGTSGPASHVQVWIDGAAPHRFRVLITGPRPVELGGVLGTTRGENFSAPDRVIDPVAYELPVIQAHLDPAAFVKAALTSGAAKSDGTTAIRGRDVIRIRVLSHRYGPPETVALYYVDAKTYRPARIVITQRGGYVFLIGFRLPTLGVIQVPSFTHFLEGQPTFEFDDYRYLPATPANRKLADLRAMHPHADVL